MKVSLLLMLAAIYGIVFGLLLLVVPDVILAGVFGAAAPPAALVGNIRGYGGVLIGVAVINWFARNSEPSQARDAIMLGMFVGFLALTLTGILRVLGGAPTLGGIVTFVINALLAIAFGIVGKANMSTQKS